jgi:hypothetical protein
VLASVYVFGICVVATILFVVVDKTEPNRRLALTLKLIVVAAACAAILNHLLG